MISRMQGCYLFLLQLYMYYVPISRSPILTTLKPDLLSTFDVKNYSIAQDRSISQEIGIAEPALKML